MRIYLFEATDVMANSNVIFIREPKRIIFQQTCFDTVFSSALVQKLIFTACQLKKNTIVCNLCIN